MKFGPVVQEMSFIEKSLRTTVYSVYSGTSGGCFVIKKKVNDEGEKESIIVTRVGCKSRPSEFLFVFPPPNGDTQDKFDYTTTPPPPLHSYNMLAPEQR